MNDEQGTAPHPRKSETDAQRIYVRVAGEMLYVPVEDVTSLVVCARTGNLPHECGAYECENGCPDVELTYVRAEVLDA